MYRYKNILKKKREEEVPWFTELAEFLSGGFLEEELRRSLTEEDLAQLGIPTYCFPKMGRGLPRVSSQVKEPFRNVAQLKRHYIDRALLYLYTSLVPPQDASVVLLTWVIADGMGDYYAQQETAQVLRKAYPHLSITLITLLHRDREAPIEQGEWSQHLIRYSGELNGPIIHEAFSDSLYEILRQADLVLEIPTAFPHLTGLQQLMQHQRFERVGEHSLIEAAPYHPFTGARCMGLHFLEKGIFSKQVPVSSWNKLFSIHNRLFQKNTPIDSYLETHTFDFMYTKTFRGTYLYLYTLLSALAEDPKDTDICFFHMPLLAKILEKKLPHSLLASWNIGEVQIYYRSFLTKIPIAGRGKIVRLIHCETLAHEEVLALTSLSQNLIGCTGDQSVLEAIATGKPFFYDPPPFKRPFLKDLLALVEHRVPGVLADFFRLCSLDYVDETAEQLGTALGKLLKHSELKHDFQKLRDILRQEYPFEPILLGLVNRAVAHRRHPDLASFEEKQLNAFTAGEVAGKTALEQIQNQITYFIDKDMEQ